MGAKNAKKHKFNAVDAVILAVLIAAIGVAVFLLAPSAGDSAKKVTIEYVVELRTIRDEYTDNFEVGQEIIDSVAKYKIGKIAAIDVAPAYHSGTDFKAGELALYEYPEHSDVSLTVVSEATVGKNGRYVVGGGFDLSVGTTVNVRLPNYTGVAYCTQLKETEDISK